MTVYRCACGAIVEPTARVCAACVTDLQPRSADKARPQVTRGSYGGRYYLTNGRMVGPRDGDELLRSLRAGGLSEDCLVWSPGMKEWIPVSEIEHGTAADQAEDEGGSAWPAEPESGPMMCAREPAPGIGGPYVDRPYVDRPAEAAAGRPALTATGSGDPGDGASAATGPPFTDFAGAPPRPYGASPPRPWRRWFARILDTTLAALALGILTGIISPGSRALENNLSATLIVLAAWLLAEAFLLTMFGTTPGKALMNIQLSRADGHALNPHQAFARSFRVWFFGMGAGLPIANLVMMALAYRRLVRDGATSWDREGGLVIRHGRVGPGRLAAIVLFVIAYAALVVASSMPE